MQACGQLLFTVWFSRLICIAYGRAYTTFRSAGSGRPWLNSQRGVTSRKIYVFFIKLFTVYKLIIKLALKWKLKNLISKNTKKLTFFISSDFSSLILHKINTSKIVLYSIYTKFFELTRALETTKFNSTWLISFLVNFANLYTAKLKKKNSLVFDVFISCKIRMWTQINTSIFLSFFSIEKNLRK